MKPRTWVLEKVGALSKSVFGWTKDQRILLGPLPNCSKLLVPDKSWAPSQIKIFDGDQNYAGTVLTWFRKNLWSSMFWWGILRKSSIPTTSNRPLPGLKHVNERRWWQYKASAPSKSRIFDGAQSTHCWRESERTISSLMFWWGILRTRSTCELPLQAVKHLNQRRWWLYKVWATAKIMLKSTQRWPEWERTRSSLMFWWWTFCGRVPSQQQTSNLSLQVVKYLNQRRWWLCKVWAPSKITIFDGVQIDTGLTRVRKNYIEPNVLVRHLVHPNSM